MDNGDMLNTIKKVTGLIKYKFNDQPYKNKFIMYDKLIANKLLKQI